MLKLKALEQIEPGNPFLSDQFHMGTPIGKNVVVMFSKHSHEEQPYIIVCNTKTGERLRIEFDEEAQEVADKHDLFDSIMGGTGQKEQSKPDEREEMIRLLVDQVNYAKDLVHRLSTALLQYHTEQVMTRRGLHTN